MSTEVMLVHNGEGVAGTISGVQNSRSRWGSPLAARNIQHRMKIELALAIKNHMAAGKPILFLVSTVRHKSWNSLFAVLKGLKAGMVGMMSGSKWAEDKKRFGIEGYHSDYEYTWGEDNGHHPHKNTVLFLEKALSGTELDALHGSLFGRYAQRVVGAGLDSPTPKRGLRIQQVTTWGSDAATVAGYVGKGGFGVASEMTGSATKTGGEGHFTAGELLDRLAWEKTTTGEYNPVTLQAYRDYEREFKGLHSSWSRGTKKALGIDFISDEDLKAMEEELFTLADVEIIERPEPKKRTGVIAIPAGEWKKLWADFVARKALEDVLGDGSSPEHAQRLVGAILDGLGVGWEPRMTPFDDVDLDTLMPSELQALSRDLVGAVLDSNPVLPVTS